jgi:hypothetical protein
MDAGAEALGCRLATNPKNPAAAGVLQVKLAGLEPATSLGAIEVLTA